MGHGSYSIISSLLSLKTFETKNKPTRKTGSMSQARLICGACHKILVAPGFVGGIKPELIVHLPRALPYRKPPITTNLTWNGSTEAGCFFFLGHALET